MGCFLVAVIIDQKKIKKKITKRAWETWNVIVTMLEVGLEKLKEEPNKNPILWAWEVWKKGAHKRGIVYATFLLLNSLSITEPIDITYPWAVKFKQVGIQKLLEKTNDLPCANQLQRVRVEVITKLLNEFYGNLQRSVPK